MRHERVTGSFSGYYVAVYACDMGEMGDKYLGFYKICRAEPANYWESDCLLKGCCQQLRSRGADALERAESLARIRIGTLPPLIQLAAYQENRGLYWFEREDLKQAANSAQ